MNASPNLKSDLIGTVLLDEWRITEAINLKDENSTGGFFCIPFKVQNLKNQATAFLKVLNVLKAIQRYENRGIGILEALSRISADHKFERDLLETCRDRRLNRVVQPLASGELSVEIAPIGKIGFPFLILELGDGDTYKYFTDTSVLEHAWWFSMLHQAATGIQQLHSIDVSHQDLKPSNVIFFGIDNAKVADLGRAAKKGIGSRNDDRQGDGYYVPPEYYYGYKPTEWNERYLSLDLYLLGSLAYTGFSMMSMTKAILSKIPPEFGPQNYTGNYTDVLPVLIKAFADRLAEIRTFVPDNVRDIFISTVEQLCHPDPAKRGHPKNHASLSGNKYSLERYVSAFRHMAVHTKNSIP